VTGYFTTTIANSTSAQNNVCVTHVYALTANDYANGCQIKLFSKTTNNATQTFASVIMELC
jgi:hypothetical protein